MSLRTILAITMLAITSTYVLSAEKFGIEVFPGSTEDAALTNLSKESAEKMQEGLPPANRIQFEQTVYVSSEAFDKILAFYEEKFAMKAAPFNPESPTPLGPEGFALLQEIEMKDAVTSAKFFNPALDPAKFDGKVKLALFNKPNLPMVSVMDRGLNWKDGSVINQSIISVTKQPELPKVQAPAQEPAATEQPAAPAPAQ
jgi:hypothetical protein